jgi:hypothetical protein
MKNYIHVLVAALLAFPNQAAWSQLLPPTLVSATIISAGEILPITKTTSIQSDDSHNGALFEMDANEVPTFKQSLHPEHISAIVGTEFGILVQVDGGKPLKLANVRTRWTHPKFSDGVTVEEWPSPMNFGYGRYAGWVIEDLSELVPGKWKVEILYKGKILASQVFNVELASDFRN